mmetsp:Transcript_27000/g.42172  ORF Transcript_27000/g.42172 Transcript_27000/m.42172 type:complete len:136 (-) Transcript_27000:90-497(-)|eukprot:CAMPEP_0184313998 /NCGR_PEP_ID=MMETSP1049-20130417/69990_1 /TAXON_ID=77928 /ORGANISM="Proteomonas sulcata, Strain CCMP704" /LENGTH=135 /DNA_ID=CAMNT_0026631671 /DNA_START=137 /DNA_END=544 /DNA_ORIENTATION=-
MRWGQLAVWKKVQQNDRTLNPKTHEAGTPDGLSEVEHKAGLWPRLTKATGPFSPLAPAQQGCNKPATRQHSPQAPRLLGCCLEQKCGLVAQQHNTAGSRYKAECRTQSWACFATNNTLGGANSQASQKCRGADEF